MSILVYNKDSGEYMIVESDKTPPPKSSEKYVEWESSPKYIIPDPVFLKEKYKFPRHEIRMPNLEFKHRGKWECALGPGGLWIYVYRPW